MTDYSPKGPYRLITVNDAPERAKRIIGKVLEELKNLYTIDYVANCLGPDEVESKVKYFKPDLLFCASMWTSEQSEEIVAIAQDLTPNIRTHVIPHGLQKEKGPDAVVEHLKHQIPILLE